MVLTWNRVKSTVALVVTTPRLPRTSLLLLHPPHPGVGKAGLLSTGNIGSGLVMEVPEARAVIDPKPAAIAYHQNHDDVPAGAVWITDDGQLAVAGHISEYEMSGFTLHDGQATALAPQQAWFPKWSIMAPDANGDFCPLCEIDATLPASPLSP